MHPEDCFERIRLVEEYSRSVTDFNTRLEALRHVAGGRSDADWCAAETARAESERAWVALEQHIAEHQCLGLRWASSDSVDTDPSSHILGRAAAAALDVILVVDDDRRFVEVNEAAADILGLPRIEILGRCIEEFFTEARGEAITEAWDGFVSEGVQFGICKLRASGGRRSFAYRAKANFATGLHLSVLREVHEAAEP